MHFGLEGITPYVMYGGALLAVILTLVWRPIIGLLYLVPLIPLQTIRYWMNDLPLGQSVVDIMLFVVALGIVLRGGWIFPKTPLTRLLVGILVLTYVSLWLGAFRLGTGYPLSLHDPRLVDWKDQVVTPILLFFLTYAAIKDRRDIVLIVLLMCLSGLVLSKTFYGEVSDRDYSQYSEALREDEGAIGYVGSNGLAAFEGQFAAFLLGMAAFEKRKAVKILLLGTSAFAVICLLLSLSRGGYVGFLMAWLFLGMVRYRTLLVLLIAFLVTWQAVVPPAVVQRVNMTVDGEGNLEKSADTRVKLWDDALDLFYSSPVIGSGIHTYAYMNRVGKYRDTHNYYLKVLAETGVVGMFFFLLLLVRMFWFGFRAFRSGRNPLTASLGLAICAWLVCVLGVNFFGDRWTYLQISGFLWVLLGCLARAIAIENEPELAPENTEPAREVEPALVTAG